MKKIAFLSALALCLGFTSCDNYEEPNPPAQSNPQETVLEANGLAFSQGADAADGQVISLAQYNDEGKQVEVAKVDFTQEFPASYDLKVVMEVAKDNTFGRVAQIPAVVNGNSVTVSPDDLQGGFVSVIGKNPAQATLYGRFVAYAVKGDEQVRLGGSADFTYGPLEYKVIPFPSDVVIEEAYYLI
ncbi:MAG: hypothetical protein K2H61_04105, partial [Muribaculaceae bacterium]|nr:hypothetical protein [Muribaculaceae bacterium]